MADFSSTLRINGNQLRDAVMQRTTAATQVADITRRAQIGYSDTVEKILYFDGTTIRFVASETYVNSQITANLLTVAPASANLLDITGNQISLKSLAIIKVRTDATSTTLSAALAARTPVYNATNVGNGTADLQEGDVLILANATGGQQVYIHNGGVAGTVADFTLMEQPQINNASIRALFSATNGLSYNSASGIFSLGGTLTGTTTIDTNTRILEFKQGNADGDLSYRQTTSDIIIGSLNRGKIQVTTTAVIIGNNGGIGDLQVDDQRPGVSAKGLQYLANYSAGFTARSLVDKGYVDGLAVKRSTQTVNTVADSFLTITHGFALADKDSIQVVVYKAGVMTFPDIETVDVNSIRIRTSQAETGLKVFMIA